MYAAVLLAHQSNNPARPPQAPERPCKINVGCCKGPFELQPQFRKFDVDNGYFTSIEEVVGRLTF